MPFADGTSLETVLTGLAPKLLRRLLDRFSFEGGTTSALGGGQLHSGTLRFGQTEPLDLGFGRLHLPGLTAGIPFRLAGFDMPAGRWHLDLVLDGLSLTVTILSAPI